MKIYLVSGAAGDYECSWEFPVITTLSEEKALVLCEEFNTKTDELKARLGALERPSLKSWSDPDIYQEYVKQCEAHRAAENALQREHPVAKILGDDHVNLDAVYNYDVIELIEE